MSRNKNHLRSKILIRTYFGSEQTKLRLKGYLFLCLVLGDEKRAVPIKSVYGSNKL